MADLLRVDHAAAMRVNAQPAFMLGAAGLCFFVSANEAHADAPQGPPPPPPNTPSASAPIPTSVGPSEAAQQSVAAAAQPQSQQQPALRIDQAISLALANNERARKVPLRVEVAEGSLDRARDAFFPTVTAQGSAAYKFQADKTGRNWTNTGTLGVNQPIISPSAFPQYSQASHQRESEYWGSIQDRRMLEFDTARAFLQALASERVLAASNSRLDRAKTNLLDAQARAAAGLASTNDITKAQVELTSSQTQVVTSEGRVGVAYLNLGFLVGRQVTPPLAEPERTTKAANSTERAPDNQVKAALDRRPDLRSAHEHTESLQASAREPLYRLIPSLSGSLQVHVLPDPLPTEQAHDETATLNLTWTIFDAGLRYADRKTRVAQAESQALDESTLRRSIDNDIRVALTNLKTARDAFKIAEDGVVIAQKNVDETQILYKQGLARLIEVNDATSSLFDADVTRAAAKLTMEQGYLELRFALGLGPLNEEEGAPK